MSRPHASSLTPADLETLAAFIDGRLEATARAAVVARLADDEDFYEVYAETLHVLEAESPTPSADDLDPDGDRSAVAPPAPIDFERARRKRRLWPIIGTVAAVLAAALGFWLTARQPPRLAGDFLAALGEIPPATSFEWSGYRGPEEVPTWLTEDGKAARAAVFRLRVGSALAQGDWEEARSLAGKLEDYSEAVIGLWPFEDLADLIAARDRQRIDTVVDESEAMVSEIAPSGYRLGLWTQTCAWAAERGDRDYFSRSKARRGLRDLGAAALVPAAADAVGEIEKLLAGSGPGIGELPELGAACTQLGGALTHLSRRE